MDYVALTGSCQKAGFKKVCVIELKSYTVKSYSGPDAGPVVWAKGTQSINENAEIAKEWGPQMGKICFNGKEWSCVNNCTKTACYAKQGGEMLLAYKEPGVFALICMNPVSNPMEKNVPAGTFRGAGKATSAFMGVLEEYDLGE